MKRIVFPLLLSSAYVALMTVLFSSPFGQENNFLFEETSFSAFTNRIELTAQPLLPVAEEPVVKLETTPIPTPTPSEEHSPESAAD